MTVVSISSVSDGEQFSAPLRTEADLAPALRSLLAQGVVVLGSAGNVQVGAGNSRFGGAAAARRPLDGGGGARRKFFRPGGRARAFRSTGSTAAARATASRGRPSSRG